MAEILNKMGQQDYKNLGAFTKHMFAVFNRLSVEYGVSTIILNPFRNVFIWDEVTKIKKFKEQLKIINLYVQTTLDDNSQYIVIRHKSINMIFLQNHAIYKGKTYMHYYLVRTDIKSFLGNDMDYRRIMWEIETLFDKKSHCRFHKHAFAVNGEIGIYKELVQRRKLNVGDSLRNEIMSDEIYLEKGPFFNTNIHPKKPNEDGEFLSTFHGAEKRDIQIFVDKFDRFPLG